MLSIHNNLSAGAQNVTGSYACLQVLANNALTWQSSYVIANNTQKQQKLFVQGYNLKFTMQQSTCENIVPLQLIILHLSQVFV